jgi:succinate-semialdehyde dehydrogenase / glutarate-semialdehyde dehydrogenase
MPAMMLSLASILREPVWRTPERLEEQVGRAVADGATVSTRGTREGNYSTHHADRDISPDSAASREEFERVAEQLDVGMVFINLVGPAEPALPFGGVKRSAFGRGLGRLGADEFANKKLICRAGRPGGGEAR